MRASAQPTWHLPSLEALVDAADAVLHPWVHRHVPVGSRREALSEGPRFWLHTAAQDLEYAATYAANAPKAVSPRRTGTVGLPSTPTRMC
jgi:hypothetical protein